MFLHCNAYETITDARAMTIPRSTYVFLKNNQAKNYREFLHKIFTLNKSKY